MSGKATYQLERLAPLNRDDGDGPSRGERLPDVWRTRQPESRRRMHQQALSLQRRIEVVSARQIHDSGSSILSRRIDPGAKSSDVA
jgi:hypothetical protein